MQSFLLTEENRLSIRARRRWNRRGNARRISARILYSRQVSFPRLGEIAPCALVCWPMLVWLRSLSTPRPPASTRCAFVQKLLRQPPAYSLSLSTDRAARVATIRTVDPNPRRPPTSACAAKAAVPAHSSAFAAERTCSPRLTPHLWRPQRGGIASALPAASHAVGALFANRVVDGLVVETVKNHTVSWSRTHRYPVQASFVHCQRAPIHRTPF